ncbi:MAG TPA: histidine--tRNA ligase [Armatimonadetes bacterium]|nr:histidine--tRNA ligase [Armatimonadota bacterium]
MPYRRPRGTQDILPAEAAKWQAVEATFREICERFGYGEIRTPMFEQTELFVRSVGESTDIVAKEMYTFTDRGGRSMTLRPEGTAPVVRAYLENGLYAQGGVQKFYYLSAIFRYERRQEGRYRQHHQAGIEALGSLQPSLDVEVITLGLTYLSAVGLDEVELLLNSIGCPRCRPVHREALRAYLRDRLDHLCPDCQRRFEVNPLRILDCKVPTCQTATQDAPVMLDYLCSECAEHFTAVRKGLTDLEVAYTLQPRLVRGLDYYTKTAFEIAHPALGAQNVLLGGGRYDGLVEQCGGPPTPGIGFGSGLERVLLALEKTGRTVSLSPRPRLYIAAVSPPERVQAQQLAWQLRREGLRVELDHEGRSLKGQMRQANRLGAALVLLLKEDELAAGQVTLRDMRRGEQELVPLEGLPERTIRQLGHSHRW